MQSAEEVHLVHGMQIAEPLQGFAADVCNGALFQRKAIRGDDIGDAATAAVLHNNPQRILSLNAADVVHNVWMIAHLHRTARV